MPKKLVYTKFDKLTRKISIFSFNLDRSLGPTSQHCWKGRIYFEEKKLVRTDGGPAGHNSTNQFQNKVHSNYIMDLTAEKELSIIISFILTGVDKKMTGLILMICYLPASKQTKTNYF